MKYTGRNGWQASRRDTWSLDNTLAPIIHSGLVKFKEVITSPDTCAGIPQAYVTWGDDHEEQEGEFDRQFNLWVADIDKMVFAFSGDEHEVHYEGGWEDGEHHGEVCEAGSRRHDKVPTNPEELKLVREAEKCHHVAKQEGRKLFATHYESLWW